VQYQLICFIYLPFNTETNILKYAAEFFQQANKSILTDDYSYLKLELHKDECADGGWLLRTRNNDQVFAIFIDGKSRDKAADDVGSYSEPRALLPFAVENHTILLNLIVFIDIY
jgi:hypothetical protein